MAGKYQRIEELDMFTGIEAMCDEVWDEVHGWGHFDKDTVGKQLVRAADSVGANLVEGDGRHHHRDSLRFMYTSRASAREMAYWLRRARRRGLMTPQKTQDLLTRTDTAIRQINAIIRKRREWATTVKDAPLEYPLEEETWIGMDDLEG